MEGKSSFSRFFEVKEDVDQNTNETIPRKYFSGGDVSYAMASQFERHDVVGITHDSAMGNQAMRNDESRDDVADFAMNEANAAMNTTIENILKDFRANDYFGIWNLRMFQFQSIHPIDYKNFEKAVMAIYALSSREGALTVNGIRDTLIRALDVFAIQQNNLKLAPVVAFEVITGVAKEKLKEKDSLKAFTDDLSLPSAFSNWMRLKIEEGRPAVEVAIDLARSEAVMTAIGSEFESPKLNVSSENAVDETGMLTGAVRELKAKGLTGREWASIYSYFTFMRGNDMDSIITDADYGKEKAALIRRALNIISKHANGVNRDFETESQLAKVIGAALDAAMTGKEVVIDKKYKATLEERDGVKVLVLDKINGFINLEYFFEIMQMGMAQTGVKVEGIFHITTITLDRIDETFAEFKSKFYAKEDAEERAREASPEGQAKLKLYAEEKVEAKRKLIEAKVVDIGLGVKATLVERDGKQVWVMNKDNSYYHMHNFFMAMRWAQKQVGDNVEGTYNGMTITITGAPETFEEFKARLYASDEAMVTQEINVDQLNTLIPDKGYKGAYLFLGHGSKGQFNDVKEMERALDQVVGEFNLKYGQGKWLLVFGGDPANEQKPDIGYLVKRAKEKYPEIPVLAVQADEYKKWGVGDFVDYVYYYPTQRDADGNILYGGNNANGELIGSSKFYLGDEFVKSGLSGIVSFGGGAIAKDEVNYALKNGLNVISYKIAPRFEPASGEKFGVLDGWLDTQAEMSNLQRRAAPNAVTTQVIDEDQLNALPKKYQATYLFLGFGGITGFKDTDEIDRASEEIVREFNEKHGKGKWLLVYGGDPVEGLNIGELIRRVKVRHPEVPVLAVQADSYLEKGLLNWGFIDYVFFYKKPDIDEKLRYRLYAGYDESSGKLYGATNYYLGDKFIESGLKGGGVVAFGGGTRAGQEVQYAVLKGLNVISYKIESGNKKPETLSAADWNKYGAPEGVLEKLGKKGNVQSRNVPDAAMNAIMGMKIGPLGLYINPEVGRSYQMRNLTDGEKTEAQSILQSILKDPRNSHLMGEELIEAVKNELLKKPQTNEYVRGAVLITIVDKARHGIFKNNSPSSPISEDEMLKYKWSLQDVYPNFSPMDFSKGREPLPAISPIPRWSSGAKALVTAVPRKLVNGLKRLVKGDNAMSAYGGIDLNAANLNLVIKRDGYGVPLPLAQQDMAQLTNIEGLDPVILSIKPASQSSLFSHLQTSP